MGNMKKFKEHLSESISPASVSKASQLIARYITKKAKIGKLFAVPGVEGYSNSQGRGVGIRFMVPKGNKSFRFNWTQAGMLGSANLDSIDFWNNEKKPFHVQFNQGVSLVQTLPLFVQMMADGFKKKKIVFSEPTNVALRENASNLVRELLDFLASRGTFTQNDIYFKFRNPGVGVYKELIHRFPTIVRKEGRKFSWEPDTNIVAQILKSADEILQSTGAVKGTVTRGASAETYDVDPEVAAMEANKDRLSFEQQLQDLENLLKLTVVAGSSNAIFIAGRGGIGKTHTTEKVLSKLGFEDGKQYFKNTGSISTAGLYSLMFKYKNQIIFFDDSDDVFKDQSSRNLIKAATDTKKIRKLVWNKQGSNVIEPGEMTDEEILEGGNIPRFFEFTGKIIFISNMKPDKLDPDGAIRTRAFMVDIDPTEEEIYDFMDKIVEFIPIEGGIVLDIKERKYVVQLLRNSKSKQTANLRKLSRGLNMFAGSIKSGIKVSDDEMSRMISMYA